MTLKKWIDIICEVAKENDYQIDQIIQNPITFDISNGRWHFGLYRIVSSDESILVIQAKEERLDRDGREHKPSFILRSISDVVSFCQIIIINERIRTGTRIKPSRAPKIKQIELEEKHPTGLNSGETRIQSGKIEWRVLSKPVRTILRVWKGKQEQKWVELVWNMLVKRRLTQYNSHLERHEVLIRFFAICSLYLEFTGIAWDLYDFSQPFVDGAHLRHFQISPFQMGRLYHPDPDDTTFLEYSWLTEAISELEEAEEDTSELTAKIIQYCAIQHKKEIYDILLEEYQTTDRLFAALWNTQWETEEEIATADEILSTVGQYVEKESDARAGKRKDLEFVGSMSQDDVRLMGAFEWVNNGFQHP